MGRDSGWAGEYTDNKIVLAYASVRYSVGTKLAHFLQDHEMTNGVWHHLFKWAHGSEGAYNCLILPELGKKIREENALNRYGRFFDYPNRKPLTRKLATFVSKHFSWIERQYRIRWIDQQIEHLSRTYPTDTEAQINARKQIIADYERSKESWRKN